MTDTWILPGLKEKFRELRGPHGPLILELHISDPHVDEQTLRQLSYVVANWPWPSSDDFISPEHPYTRACGMASAIDAAVLARSEGRVRYLPPLWLQEILNRYGRLAGESCEVLTRSLAKAGLSDTEWLSILIREYSNTSSAALQHQWIEAGLKASSRAALACNATAQWQRNHGAPQDPRYGVRNNMDTIRKADDIVVSTMCSLVLGGFKGDLHQLMAAAKDVLAPVAL